MVMGHKCEQQMAQIVQQPMCHLKLQNDQPILVLYQIPVQV